MIYGSGLSSIMSKQPRDVFKVESREIIDRFIIDEFDSWEIESVLWKFRRKDGIFFEKIFILWKDDDIHSMSHYVRDVYLTIDNIK